MVKHSVSVFGLVLSLLMLCPALHVKGVTRIHDRETGITVAFSETGKFTVHVADPGWDFSGFVGQAVTKVRMQRGKDEIGSYDEISFDWSDQGKHNGTIRLYRARPIMLFISRSLTDCRNTRAFPTFQRLPNELLHLSYKGTFGHYTFSELSSDSPWIAFDLHASTYILSAASNFLVASTLRTPEGETRSGIDPNIQQLPAGFTHSTLLMFDRGINRAFESWGQVITALTHKKRPSNDADITLKYFGYWTDNGATYYYRFEPSLGYEGTLLAVRDDFLRQHIPLGYMQLDSWFYPKGPQQRWDIHGGIYKYVASPALFPEGLQAFQRKLGLPLVTHARWIDPSSPYHQQYAMSRNVVTDAKYWEQTAQYLHEARVVTYEQDWLDDKALPAMSLQDPSAFMDHMAAACRANRLAIQYCMPLPRHYMQTARYDEVTTIRTSGDRFERGKWDEFLYGARLASALGVWPWADVFMSNETENVLLGTLSGGPVGIGDPIGKLDRRNLMRVVRSDGVIAKPDSALVPLDSSFIQDANQAPGSMVAATYSDHGTIRAWYVIAYERGTTSSAPAISPSSLGMTGELVAYDFFGATAELVSANDQVTVPQHDGFGYLILIPLGKSGMALLGDADQFVSLSRQRVSSLSDAGRIETTVIFANEESERKLFGYSPISPAVSAQSGQASLSAYGQDTRLFQITVRPDRNGVARVIIGPGQ
jgi:hypothetical protein